MFKFKFEAILKLKKQMEKKAQNELAVANTRLRSEQEKLDDLVDKRDKAFLEVQSESGLINVLKLREYSKFIEVLKNRIHTQKNNVNKAQENVDILSEKLREAVKEKKIFERLKEKKYREFLIKEGKKEQMLADEIVSYKTAKGNEEGGD